MNEIAGILKDSAYDPPRVRGRYFAYVSTDGPVHEKHIQIYDPAGGGWGVKHWEKRQVLWIDESPQVIEAFIQKDISELNKEIEILRTENRSRGDTIDAQKKKVEELEGEVVALEAEVKNG